MAGYLLYSYISYRKTFINKLLFYLKYIDHTDQRQKLLILNMTHIVWHGAFSYYFLTHTQYAIICLFSVHSFSKSPNRVQEDYLEALIISNPMIFMTGLQAALCLLFPIPLWNVGELWPWLRFFSFHLFIYLSVKSSSQ